MTTTENKIGYVYKIVCLDPSIKDTYVGSCQAFRTRKHSHKSNCTNPNSKGYNLNVYNFIRANGGWSNFSMIAIEQVNYLVKHELLVRERFHLENLKASLNKVVPSRTQQEYREAHKTEAKAYYEEHKTEKKESNKEYREAHKTEAKEYHEAYYEKNKTEINEKQKELITCVCGKSLTKGVISRHKKSRRHRNYISPQIVISEISRTEISIL